jgi:hypothetical protein
VINDVELGDVCCMLLATDRDWRFIDPADYDRIDAEWNEFMSSGQRNDRLVHVEYPGGGGVTCPVSEIRGLQRETRDQRRAQREFGIAYESEKKADGILE